MQIFIIWKVKISNLNFYRCDKGEAFTTFSTWRNTESI